MKKEIFNEWELSLSKALNLPVGSIPPKILGIYNEVVKLPIKTDGPNEKHLYIEFPDFSKGALDYRVLTEDQIRRRKLYNKKSEVRYYLSNMYSLMVADPEKKKKYKILKKKRNKEASKSIRKIMTSFKNLVLKLFI